jgi:outer membrane protein assembly factor BamB
VKRTAALRYPTPKAPGSPIVRHAVPPEPPTGPLVRVAISSDGRVLATAGADGWLHVVELEVGRVAFSVDLGAPVVDLTLTASSVFAAIGREVRLVNGLAGRAQPPLVLDAPVRAIAVSHDGSAYAALDVTGQVVVVRTLTGRRTFAAQVAGGRCVAFTPDDRALRVGKDDGEVSVIAIGASPATGSAPGGVTPTTSTPTTSTPTTSTPTAPAIRLRDRAAQFGDRVLGPDGAVLADEVKAFDAIGDVVLVGGATGWAVVGEGSVGSAPVVDLALHPGLTHAVIAAADGAVELVALPD